MSKISGSIANIANGVSQQAMALRLATQGELQINGYSTVVDGLKKRPPTQRVATLGDLTESASDIYSHIINRDEFERYNVLISRSGIRVFTLDGEPKVVNAPNGYGYLDHSETTPPFRAVTVGDYTFITNRTKTAGLNESSRTPSKVNEAIINVMAGNYAKTYTVKIDGEVKAQYATPEGTSAEQAPGVDVSFIAARLVTGETVKMKTTINGDPNGGFSFETSDKSFEGTGENTFADGSQPGVGAVATGTGIDEANGWVVERFKSTIYIRKADGSDFSIEVDDGYNGNAMKAIKNETQDFSNLPAYCRDGVTVEVAGAPGNEYDNYHVKFEAQDNNTSMGVWREVPGPDTITEYDPATMPHVLIREADGTFTFKEAEWNKREAGTDTTTPAASFVGRRIGDVLFFKNRLGFLAGENIILSRAGSYFDYWRATATALLDDDPIDVASQSTGVSSFMSAVSYSDRLILFSAQRQFAMMGNELLTPKTASIRETTAYAASSQCRPVAAGNAVYFAVDRGMYSMVREYMIDSQTGQAEAEDITSHVPQYVPKGVYKLAASTHEDIIIGLSKEEPSKMYVYKYYWSGNRKLQSSWSVWEFPGVDSIVDAEFINSYLYLLVVRSGEYRLERMEIQPGGTDPYSDFVCNIDQRFLFESSTENSTFNPEENETTLEVPYSINSQYICVTAGGDSLGSTPGIELPVTYVAGTTVRLRGDHVGKNLYFGTNYSLRYRLSDVYIRRESQGGGLVAVTEGRLQLMHLLIQFSKSAFFQVEVTPLNRATRTYRSMGRIMGDPSNKTDTITLSDGSIKVPILSKNDRVSIEIVNDSYLPSSLLSAEWVGRYDQKSRRI